MVALAGAISKAAPKARPVDPARVRSWRVKEFHPNTAKASWAVNKQAVASHYLERYRKLKRCMEKIKLVRAIYKLKKDKAAFYDALNSYPNLVQVLENDKLFRTQLMEAVPVAKYYINQMLANIDDKYKMRYKPEPTKYNSFLL